MRSPAVLKSRMRIETPTAEASRTSTLSFPRKRLARPCPMKGMEFTTVWTVFQSAGRTGRMKT